MWAIVGLGNFPAKYAGTRHNIGFMVVEALASRHSFTFKDKKNYRFARGTVGDTEAVLVEPLTYMNLSGTAVARVLREFPVTPDNLLVVHDDIDLPVGKLRLRPGGSSGGHRGIESIFEHGGCGKDFIRLKIGVGRDPEMPAEQFVLKKFRPHEKPLVEESVIAATEAIELLLSKGMDEAMNSFN